MTPFETILVSAIGTGIVGIASFITWFVKLILPKMFETWDRLIKSVDSMGEKIAAIPSNLTEMKATLDKNTVEVHEVRSEMISLRKDVTDQRFADLRKDLQDQIDRNSLSERSLLRDGPESRRVNVVGNNN